MSDPAPEIAVIDQALRAFGKSSADCAALVRSVGDRAESQAAIIDLKKSIVEAGVECPGDTFERALLAHAMLESEPRIGPLCVHHSVKALLCREFQRFRVPGSPGPPVLVGTDPFTTAAKICTLRRFPAGPLDWVISGVPRSWFLKMPVGKLIPALRFIFGQFGGLKPAFYVHVAHPPRNRSLLLRNEVRKCYYRLACSLALQPEMKGIICASWFLDPNALKDGPHLAAINEPYLEWGGRVVSPMGPAAVESGFLKFDPERRAHYERGELKLMTTLGLWPRRAALAWAAEHPELDDSPAAPGARR